MTNLSSFISKHRIIKKIDILSYYITYGRHFCILEFLHKVLKYFTFLYLLVENVAYPIWIV